MGSFHMDWAMKGSVLILMLCVLLADTTLGLDLSFAPGLSVTNAFLYLIIVAYFIETDRWISGASFPKKRQI